MSKMDSDKLLEIGFSHLKDYQKDVIEKCIKMKNGTIAMGLGSGKTITSLCYALKVMDKSECLLWICSKTLLSNCVGEIKKFFGDSLKYIIIHNEYIKDIDNFKLDPSIRLVLTTSEVTSSCYKDLSVESELVYYVIRNEGHFNQHSVCCYNRVDASLRKNTFGPGLLYSTRWGCLIIDEAQNYTNVTTGKCRSLVALCANHKWCLSGTLFSEPKVERILGYHLLIGAKFPCNLPDAKKFVESKDFKGLNRTQIEYKEKNVPFEIVEHYVTNDMNPSEEKIYLSMKKILGDLKKKADTYKNQGDTERSRVFSAYLLAMLTYLREAIVNPLVPLATIFVNMSNLKEKTQLSTIIMDHIGKLGLETYLNDENNVISSRMYNVLETVVQCPDKIVLFTCYRTNLDILSYALAKVGRSVMTLSGDMSIKKRESVLKAFAESKDTVLLLTYSIGGEGLNLQSAHTVMFMDYDWSDSKTSQGEARVARKGQLAKNVIVYYFISNLAIEKAIFQKQREKMIMLREARDGPIKSKIKKISTADIINIITSDENRVAFRDIRGMYK